MCARKLIYNDKLIIEQYTAQKKAERQEIKKKLDSIKEQLPTTCRNCSFLIITSLKEQKVYCPYLIKNECLRGGNKICRNLKKEINLYLQDTNII